MNFDPQSKVWVYLSRRKFSDADASELQKALNEFCIEWTAHNVQLKAAGEVRHGHFIILMVDETNAGASGCSIDKSVHFIKALEQRFHLELFNRLQFAWMENDEVQVSPLHELRHLIHEKKISDDTTVFNPVIGIKKDLDENWMIPLKKSWLAQSLAKEKVQ